MALSASEYVKKKSLRSNTCGRLWVKLGILDLDLGVSVAKLCFQMLSCTAGAPLVKQKNKESLG